MSYIYLGPSISHGHDVIEVQIVTLNTLYNNIGVVEIRVSTELNNKKYVLRCRVESKIQMVTDIN